MGAVSGDSSHVSGEGEASGWISLWMCLNTSNELPRYFLRPSPSFGNVVTCEENSRYQLLGFRSTDLADENRGSVVPDYGSGGYYSEEMSDVQFPLLSVVLQCQHV